MPIRKEPFNKWDIRFIDLAKMVSEWSKDPRSKIGAVIATDREGAIALGYNGFPRGIEDDSRLDEKILKNDIIIHAEQNALLLAGSRANGASIYVWGKPVCSRCAVVIIQAEIKNVIAISPEKETDPVWKQSGELALELFKQAKRNVWFFDASSYKMNKEPNGNTTLQ